MNNVIRVLFGTLFIILCTQVDIDLHLGDVNIPITGQSFAVVLVGYLLKSKLGALSVFIYLLLGMVGAPVFADGGSGIDSLWGNSGGYLYGFIPAAFACGYLHERGWGSLPYILFAMIIGTVIILCIGVSHLSIKIGIEKALTYGLYPFIPGAILKLMLATGVAFMVKYTKTED